MGEYHHSDRTWIGFKAGQTVPPTSMMNSSGFSPRMYPSASSVPIPIQKRFLTPSSTGITPSQSSASFTEPGPVGIHDITGTSSHSLEFLVKNTISLHETPPQVEGPVVEGVAEPGHNPEEDGIGFEPIVGPPNDDVIQVMDGDKSIMINKKDGSVVRPIAVKDELTFPVGEATSGFMGLFRKTTKSNMINQQSGSLTMINPADPISSEGRTGGNEHKFMGEGQIYKGKLIGVLAVQEARGDRMCQDALQELKMAIKASGEHKQKVVIHIAVDGLKIRDEKTGDCLYHHPVHKISFIAQDMADNRAFGYIYGSPENGHRFFGIKTEKQASQVVVAMRDLFQVVFELKKKEIDEAKEQLSKDRRELIQQASLQQQHQQQQSGGHPTTMANFPEQPIVLRSHQPDIVPTSSGFSDLLGLESQLTNIQAGIQQIDNITPNAAPMTLNTDSMLPLTQCGMTRGYATSLPSSAGGPQANTRVVATSQKSYPQAIMNTGPPLKADAFGSAPFLPPPPSKLRQRSIDGTGGQAQGTIHQQHSHSGAFGGNFDGFHQPQGIIQPPPHQQQQKPAVSCGFNGFDGVFQPQVMDPTRMQKSGNAVSESKPSGMFTDLDPLGSGKSKPFVDKKDFFSEKKSPTQKVPMSALGQSAVASPPSRSPDALSNAKPGNGANPLDGLL